MQHEIEQSWDRALPGITCRTELRRYLDDCIVAAKASDESFAVILLDMEDFREINYLGLLGGDEILSTIIRAVSRLLAPQDELLRTGRDEFSLVLRHLGHEDDAAMRAQRCLSTVKATIATERRDLRAMASIGLARYPRDGECSVDLIAAANDALTSVKENHNGTLAFNQPESPRATANLFANEDAIQQAFIGEEFRLHYQPQVDLRSGKVRGVGALVRWQHSELGLLDPGSFLPVLERTGHSRELDVFVIDSVCAQLQRWRRSGNAPESVSVKISASHLDDPQIVDFITESLRRNDLHPACLELDVAEASLNQESTHGHMLGELRSLGVRLAIDHFGTGNASLAALMRLPVQRLKLDHVFVRDVLTNGRDSALLGAIVGLAHAMGFEVLGTGVKDLRQLQLLASVDCDFAQGYFFSDPVEAEHIPELTQQRFRDPR